MGWGLSQAEQAWQEAQFLVQGWVRRLGRLEGWAVALGGRGQLRSLFSQLRSGWEEHPGWAGHWVTTHTLSLSLFLPPFLPTWVVPSGPWACLLLRAEDSRASRKRRNRGLQMGHGPPLLASWGL